MRNERKHKINNIRTNYILLKDINNKIEDRIKVKRDIIESLFKICGVDDNYKDLLFSQVKDLVKLYMDNSVKLSEYEKILNELTDDLYVGGFEITKNLR